MPVEATKKLLATNAARFGRLLPLAFFLLGVGSVSRAQIVAPVVPLALFAAPPAAPLGGEALTPWEGLPVVRIDFAGVPASRLDPLPARLAQTPGTPLRQENLRRSLRQLYATGLYENVAVEGEHRPEGIVLTFRGTPRAFVGTITVAGAKGAGINTQLAHASRLDPGVRFTPARLDQAVEQMRTLLAESGFHEPVITHTLTARPQEQLVDIAFQVASGPLARVGKVQISGEPGMNADEFRRHAHLKSGAAVDHDTGNRALAGILKEYQHQDRLEAEIKLQDQPYTESTRKTDFHFFANQGPVVRVRVEGAGISMERLRHVLPIFQEGAVDDDLLNEGNRRLRDYYQRLGYFDVDVEHELQSNQGGEVTIVYRVSLGLRRSVQRVSVAGNHYFDSATLRDLLSVRAADPLDRHGAYNQALVAADIAALEAVYRNNGFSKVKITAETGAGNASPTAESASPPAAQTALHKRKTAPLSVVYRIDEGQQQRVAAVRLEGVAQDAGEKLLAQLNTTAGQLLSPQNLATDRDTLLTNYLSRGFDQARVDVVQQEAAGNPDAIDVVFKIDEGRQIFVRKVLVTGLHYTRADSVAKAITLHPGDPLDQAALAETQRNLYDFSLFNEVDTALENPTGEESSKTILLNVTEARRWVLTYGGGFEAQTGTPQNNCSNAGLSVALCNPNGKASVSPRVLLDLTRNNLFGRDQSASLRATYGLLEWKADLLFQNPHFYGNRNFGLTLSAGYAKSQDVTTYVASKLEGAVRWTEHFNTPGSFLSKANTFVYGVDFRRVQVLSSSLQVYAPEISELSAAVRVAGPSLTWIRDTRDSLLDAHRGTYTSFQEFLSGSALGAEAEFNRLDLSNSNFFSFDRSRFVLARNTRYGQERAFGKGGQELLPLPERLYAGGATSHRGFAQNGAGPRDPVTGFPIGGAGILINSTELRLPPPTLPWLGNTVSFVLFHDMGNVFSNASDAWASALRVRQPQRETCQVPSGVNQSNAATYTPTGPVNSTGQQGRCSFNYFSHTPGLGMRYHTPVGPVRFDFSYNLNPPIYPAIQDYTNPAAAPHAGEAPHFNFFFSLGQTF
jgi:outer membrane protein assembly complex protein YaeT